MLPTPAYRIVILLLSEISSHCTSVPSLSCCLVQGVGLRISEKTRDKAP
jgi:hypothetical protein